MQNIYNQRVIGILLIVLAFLFAKLVPMNGLSTWDIAKMMIYGGAAWIGVSMAIPNPNVNYWILLLKGALGLLSLVAVLVLSITATSDLMDKELEAYGVTTTALVVGKDETRLPTKNLQVNYVYELMLEFTDKSGSVQQISTEVDERMYRHTYTGEFLQLHYSSRNPEIHRIVFNHQ